MRHLRIEQSNTLTENINYKILHKLYDIMSNNELDNSSLIRGRCDSSYIYENEYDYFDNIGNGFILVINIDRIIVFQDPLVEQILISKFDISKGFLTLSDCAGITLTDTTFNSTDIEYFHEFKYFTQNNLTCTKLFAGCSKLKEITMPSITLQMWDRYPSYGMFSGCTSLTYVNWNNSILLCTANETWWGCGLFDNCDSIDWYDGILPPNINQQENVNFLFDYSDTIKKIIYPEGIKYTAVGGNMGSLEYYELPKSVISLAVSYGCNNNRKKLHLVLKSNIKVERFNTGGYHGYGMFMYVRDELYSTYVNDTDWQEESWITFKRLSELPETYRSWGTLLSDPETQTYFSN